MTNRQRTGVVLAALAALVVAFVVLSPGDDEKDTTATTTAPMTVTAEAETAPRTTTAPAPAPAPEFETIRVRGGQPVGGVRRITVTRGERVRIEVGSPDTSDEIHIHGYDLAKDLTAGGRVRFSITADAEGVFEIELEHAGVKIADLEVRPG
jgi:heme/copper-type cytochrome/quinol oxidase subunit 2